MRYETAEPTRIGVWTGHIVVAGLLALVLLAASGCSQDGDELSRTGATASVTRQRVQSRVADRNSDPTAALARTVSIEEPVEEGTDGTSFTTPENASFEDGERAYAEQRFDEAAGIFEAYTDRTPDNAWGHYMLGLSARKTGDLDRAVQAFKDALELDPDHVKSLINLGRVLLQQGNPSGALPVLEEAIDVDPTSVAAYRLRGVSQYDLGQVEGAIDSYYEALELDDNDAWSMNDLGLLLIRQERFQEAIPPLALAVRVQESAVFFNNLGIALERSGFLTQAVEAFDRALSLDEGYEKARVSRERVGQLVPGDGDEVDLGKRADSFRERIAAERHEAAELDPVTFPGIEGIKPVDSLSIQKVRIDSTVPVPDSISRSVPPDSGSTVR